MDTPQHSPSAWNFESDMDSPTESYEPQYRSVSYLRTNSGFASNLPLPLPKLLWPQSSHNGKFGTSQSPQDNSSDLQLPLPSPEGRKDRELRQTQSDKAVNNGCLPLPNVCQTLTSPIVHAHMDSISRAIWSFLSDTLPRQLYRHFLLFLPVLYFSRVARIVDDAEFSMPDIINLVTANPEQWERQGPNGIRWSGAGKALSPSLKHFKRSWEAFIDSLIQEWQTLNIVSVLLLSGILTILQVQPAGTDPVIRTAALLSLVCAFMSLLFGCVYIVRFGSMRRMSKAASWVEEVQKAGRGILWNVWVFLVLPTIWLSWSLIFFMACVLLFVWRSGSTNDPANPAPLSMHSAIGPRIAITGVFMLGLVYFILVVNTLKRYVVCMDDAWGKRVKEWTSFRGPVQPLYPFPSVALPNALIPPSPSFLKPPVSINGRKLERRPQDWRASYTARSGLSSLLPRVTRSQSDVQEINDPIRRDMYTLVNYSDSQPPIIFDLRDTPGPSTLSFPILNRVYSDLDLSQLSTNPPSHQLRLYHPRLPWYIDLWPIIPAASQSTISLSKYIWL